MKLAKRVFAFAVLAALAASVPAVARAFQHEPHPATHENPVTAEHEHGASEEAEEHGPKPINWTDFSNAEQPPYVGVLINFVILMGIYYFAGRKPVAEGLKARRASIAKEIDEANRMRDEAEARAAKYQEKLKNLETEVKEAREAMRAAGEAERERIVREAEEKAARMEKEARFLVEQEMKQMRVEIMREAVEMATGAAEELLKKRITAADQERLAEDYLAELTAKRGATPSMAPSGGAR
jgi:F-type H+-transporting ATPase subunit b